MEVMRRRWRLLIGVGIVVAAIVGLVFAPSTGISMGITLLAFLVIVILVITGTRRGGGGIEPEHTPSGSRGKGGFGL